MDAVRSDPTSECVGLSSWIAGKWSTSGGTFDVHSPATGSVIDRLRSAGSADVDAAAAAARQTFERYRATPAPVRAGWCLSASAAVLAHEDRLARELSAEHGKPVADALAEVRSAANGFRMAAGVVLGDPGESPSVADAAKRITVRREPLGVWAVITPWNFPLNIPVEYIGPALSTGNAVVWKPAPTTARIAALFREVLLEADFPQDLLQLVVTDELTVAQHLTAHPMVSAIGFTGGTAAGEAIGRANAGKHLLLELGGNTAIVVLDDADLDAAADAIAASAFWNAGQVCSAAGKVLVARPLHDALAERVADRAREAVLGDPLEPATTQGPLHLTASVERIQAHVDDACSRGARLLTGGAVDARLGGGFYLPTVLADVPEDAAAFREETFGPVASFSAYDTEEELIAAANAGSYGLVAAVHTRSASRAFRVSEALEAGLVVVNDSSNYWELNLPFGGAHGRRSGRGRLGGRFALSEFTQVKAIAIDIR
ncbi:aldehyde dehydrogenase family protein [Streptomyces sp. NPDC096057]|uniref:aldehyde dehydrogenase family protein n=1 Tax=Streptomyces sp. NPDC096057 TaxID=3155543 RepID=UPI00332F1659